MSKNINHIQRTYSKNNMTPGQGEPKVGENMYSFYDAEEGLDSATILGKLEDEILDRGIYIRWANNYIESLENKQRTFDHWLMWHNCDHGDDHDCNRNNCNINIASLQESESIHRYDEKELKIQLELASANNIIAELKKKLNVKNGIKRYHKTKSLEKEIELETIKHNVETLIDHTQGWCGCNACVDIIAEITS